MKRYLVVFEKANSNWSAFVPDLPGCVAAADTKEETAQLIREAIEFHIEGMVMGGLSVPEPSAVAEEISVAA
jgi:predicted RNase H-like HicB family nuclease